MRLPLFVLATPQDDLKSVSLMIGTGQWRLVSNHIDSILELHEQGSDCSVPVVSDQIIELKKVTQIQLKIVKAGKEKSITIFVESVSNV